MAGTQNLKVPSSEEAQEYGRRGGIASGESRRRKKNMRELALALLEAETIDPQAKEKLQAMGLEDSNGAALLVAMFQKGLNGSEEAAKFVRDTSGQAPKMVSQVITGEGMTSDDLRSMSDEELRALLEAEDPEDE